VLYLAAPAGDPGATAEVVRFWARAGADTVVLHPTPDHDLVGYVRFVADQVRPLVADL
jgi:hypothetical protein